MKRKNIYNESNSNKRARLLESLEDFISYIENYNIGENKNKLNKILPSLIKLQKLTGMESVKKTIVGHILYFLMNYEKNQDMIHTVIEGPPGVGKTTLGYILGEIYSNLDIIEQPKNKTNQLKFKIVKRSDLIAKYLGQTSHRTQEVINSVLGGVLFIDEAYSLGNNDADDSYSKECLDTLNQNLSEKKNQFLCIIAGYKNSLDRNFFAYNEGLRRRFPFTYTIEEYSPNELKNIFIGMLDNSNWGLEGYKEKKEENETNIIQKKIEFNIIDNKYNKVVKLNKEDKNKEDKNKEDKNKEDKYKEDKNKEYKNKEDKNKEYKNKEDKNKEYKNKEDKYKEDKNKEDKYKEDKNKEDKYKEDKNKEDKNKDKLLIFFEKNKQYFPNFGGDIEILIFQSKIEHCKRVFFKDDNEKKILTLEDINNGLENFKKNKKLDNNIDNKKLLAMYT
jgi:ABC-type molybdenum transport system ATPase subunit/photorepair protein PhrA